MGNKSKPKHMTSRQFLTELSNIAGETAALNFMMNIKDFSYLEFIFSLTNVRQGVGAAFSWDETPEGISYWAEVYGKAKEAETENQSI
jgi:hypothetical protein